MLRMDHCYAERLRSSPERRPLWPLPVAFQTKKGYPGRARKFFPEQLQSFGFELGAGALGKSGDVPAGACEACDNPRRDGIVAIRHYDRHRARYTLGFQGDIIVASGRHKHVDLAID